MQPGDSHLDSRTVCLYFSATRVISQINLFRKTPRLWYFVITPENGLKQYLLPSSAILGYKQMDLLILPQIMTFISSWLEIFPVFPFN
jgi:hypothetical protein